MNKYLLSDESDITNANNLEREVLYNEFKKMPIEFFSKLRHFQPQIGCLNACNICSKYASTNMSYWDEKRIRNIVAALKYASPQKNKPYIVWDRKNHRNSVIFSYLDNDPGIYEYLDKFISITYKELGVKTRISTVGFSRYNKKLTEVHKNINKNLNALAGVRLSFTPYSIGWKCPNNTFDREEYEKDIANFLKIYKPYYEYAGSGSRNFCVELRFKPQIFLKKVIVTKYKGYFIIYTDDLLYISKEKNITFENTTITDPYIHRLKLTDTGKIFRKYTITETFANEKELLNYINNHINDSYKEVEIFMTNNKDGSYYSIDPCLNDEGNNGIVIYPKTKSRLISGYLLNKRYFLNALFKYKKEKNLSSRDTFENATWTDVDNVIKIIEKEKASLLQNNRIKESEYLEKEILPMLYAYVNALKSADYNPDVFFDKNFTIDTGIICNLGRAITEFKGLVTYKDEPLTLNHERNYGNINSTMTKEGKVWRLSCDYENKVILEELDLASTATENGQMKFYRTIELEKKDKNVSYNNIQKEYFIPGQVGGKNGN